MQRVNTNRPLKAAAIFLKGNKEPLTDKDIFITERFLVVASEWEDEAPVWYNLDNVDRLEGVTIPEPQRQSEADKVRLFSWY